MNAALSAMLVAGCGTSEAGGNGPAPAEAPAQANATGNDAVSAAASAPASAPAAAVLVNLDGEGVRLIDPQSGASRLLAFETAQAQAIEALTRGFGAPPRTQQLNAECGAGPILHVEWPNGWTGLFEADRFRGWFVDDRGLATADGIGVGTSRAQVESSRTIEVEESSLGTEFRSGELGGLFESAALDAPVVALWAGLTCLFR